MREHELLRRLRRIVTYDLHQFPLNAVWPKVAVKVELSPARRLRAPIGQVDDGALCRAIDRLVRFVDEAPQTFIEGRTYEELTSPGYRAARLTSGSGSNGTESSIHQKPEAE